MPMFVKRPIPFEADQWFPGKAVKGVQGDTACCNRENCAESAPHVHTTHTGQVVRLQPGDWIVPESNGNGYYPIIDDIFRKTCSPLYSGDEAEPERNPDGHYNPLLTQCPTDNG